MLAPRLVKGDEKRHDQKTQGGADTQRQEETMYQSWQVEAELRTLEISKGMSRLLLMREERQQHDRKGRFREVLKLPVFRRR